jgi:uncharacterized membrane protein
LNRSGSAPTAARLNQNTTFLGFDVDTAAPRVLAVMIIYAAVRSLVAAATSPFWFDEVITVAVSRQPSASSMWNVLRLGADGNPPGFYLIEHAFAALIPNPSIAYRLPSIIALCCTLLCVYVYARRRAGNGRALLCALITLTTVLYFTYPVEARPYSMVVACIAFALVCYQRAPAILWMSLMGFSLALALTLHYYAVYALVPFGAAELALLLTSKRFRVGVWLALLCSIVPLIVFWPLVVALKNYYGHNFWAHPSFYAAATTYGWFFEVPGPIGLALAAVLLVGLLGGVRLSRPEIRENGRDAAEFLQERVLILGLLSLPVVVYAAAKLTHGGMINRYAVPAVLAYPLGVGLILPKLTRRSVMLLAIFVFVVVAARDEAFWAMHRNHLAGVTSPTGDLEQFINSAGYGDLPVVVTSDSLLLEYYVSPQLAKRLVTLVDLPKSVEYEGTDTIDRLNLSLHGWLPLRVYQFQEFVSTQPSFLLYSAGNIVNAGGSSFYDWFTPELLREGYSLRVVAANGNQRIYLVSPAGAVH